MRRLKEKFLLLTANNIFSHLIATMNYYCQVEADNQEQKDIADLEKRELRLTKEVKELEQG